MCQKDCNIPGCDSTECYRSKGMRSAEYRTSTATRFAYTTLIGE